MEKLELLTEVDIQWLKDRYFSDPEKQITLPKGTILLYPKDKNERLYLILEGVLAGYIEGGSGERFEIFRSGKNSFVGTYSYFSPQHESYSTVIAEEETLLAYIEGDQPIEPGSDGRNFADHFLPVIVNEIYMRQLLAHKMSIRSQKAMQKLFQAEQMATLGQMAAGLAHELNNAIGVILRNTEWLAHRASEYIKVKEEADMYNFFKIGLQEGQKLTTSEIRKRRRELEKNYDLSNQVAKQLAATGLSNKDLAPYTHNLSQKVEEIYFNFETGLVLHNMLIAANHAARVVKAVKEIGVANHQQLAEVDVNQTIEEAIVLLKAMIKKLELKLKLEKNLPPVISNHGELVQIWVNLMKNACESLLSEPSINQKLTVKSQFKNDYVKISIKDNGPGIPPDTLEQIFEPTFTTKNQNFNIGMGLGLSIVKRLVEKHQGHITVESKKGQTVFTVLLPLRAE